jgi:uncharacterized membrane protein
VSKISKIYYSTKYWFRSGGRKGKTKEWIESKCSGSNWTSEKGMKKIGKANENLQKHTDKIKKLSNKERLKRINENSKSSK